MATNKKDLEARFWKTIDSERTVMLGAAGLHPRPMTAMAENSRGPLWFFTASDTDFGEALERGRSLQALAMVMSKDHELFATVGGSLVRDRDPANIERLWNPWVSAWFPGGMDDPKVRLLRMETSGAEIWLNENSLFAGMKMLLGIDPKKAYRDSAATVRLKGGKRG